MSYWGEVFKRAFRDARKTLDHKWVKSIVGTLVLALGACVYALFEGADEGWKKVLWWLCSTVAAGLALFVVVYIWKFLGTPGKLHSEAVAHATEPSKALGEELNQAKEDLSQAKEEISKLKSQIADQETSFENERATFRAQIEAARNYDHKRTIIRKHLQEFLDRFKAFLDEVNKGAKKGPLELARIERDAKHYLEKHCPEYTHFVGDSPIAESARADEVLQPHEARRKCDARIKRLEEVLAMMG